MNWKNFVEKQNEKLYVLPAGWDSREEVAAQLGCAPDRVNEHLRPGIQSRQVEVKVFPVWDKVAKRKVSTTAYRFIEVKQNATKPAK